MLPKSDKGQGALAGIDALVAGVLAGERRRVAQAITLVETAGSTARSIMNRLYRHTGRAHVIGVTGSPGTGKSTLVGAMARHYRLRDEQVGIVAVDPSSPFSGGAILGDRVRMRDLAGDPGVFIRSMASRGNHGGLAAATSDVVRVLDAGGCGVVIVETVGVGQAEIDVARMAHTVVVVESPGHGDDIQALKAGLMEIADILVVNKSDLPGADAVVNTLRSAVEMASGRAKYEGHHQPKSLPGSDTPEPDRAEEGWQTPIVETMALGDEGVVDLIETVDAHRDYSQTSGAWRRREIERIEADLLGLIKQLAVQRITTRLAVEEWAELVEAVVNRRMDPQMAAESVMEGFG